MMIPYRGSERHDADTAVCVAPDYTGARSRLGTSVGHKAVYSGCSAGGISYVPTCWCGTAAGARYTSAPCAPDPQEGE